MEKKKKILIIEDDPFLVKMYRTKFVSEGYEVVWANNGEDGLKMALAQHPDAIILDIMMPKLSGIDMLELLGQNQKNREIPVIVMSNLSNPEEAKKAMALGAKEYLVKANFTPSAIVEKVKQYLVI